MNIKNTISIFAFSLLAFGLLNTTPLLVSSVNAQRSPSEITTGRPAEPEVSIPSGEVGEVGPEDPGGGDDTDPGDGTGSGGTGNAEVKDAICNQLSQLDSKNCDDDNTTILNNIVKPIMQALILVIGGVSVLIIVIGGLMYILSAGDANNTKRAKDTIMYAVIGLAVALFAQAIISFVIGAVA